MEGSNSPLPPPNTITVFEGKFPLLASVGRGTFLSTKVSNQNAVPMVISFRALLCGMWESPKGNFITLPIIRSIWMAATTSSMHFYITSRNHTTLVLI